MEVKLSVEFDFVINATQLLQFCVKVSVQLSCVVRHEVRLHGTSLGGRPRRCNYILTRERFQASEESAPASSSRVVDLAVLVVVGVCRLCRIQARTFVA